MDYTNNQSKTKGKNQEKRLLKKDLCEAKNLEIRVLRHIKIKLEKENLKKILNAIKTKTPNIIAIAGKNIMMLNIENEWIVVIKKSQYINSPQDLVNKKIYIVIDIKPM